MRRPLLLALTAALSLSAAIAQAPSEAQDAPVEDDGVARLEVIATGEQTLDVLTGETVLTDGGVIVDRKTGLELTAPHIRYLQGEFINATDASASMAGGVFETDQIAIDVENLTADAEGNVGFEREGLRLIAPEADIDFGREFAIFDDASGANPALQARRLILNLDGGVAVLLGPYLFQNGPFELSDDRDASSLQIDPIEREDGSVSYRAANEVDDSLWEQIEPYRNP